MNLTRRDLIRTGASAAGALAATGMTSNLLAAATAPATSQAATTRSFRPRLAVIGNGGLARYFGTNFLGKYADIVALCDVDGKRLAAYNVDFAAGKAFTTGDYRKVLERSDVDVCYIATPDHWHTKIAIDAMRAGKD